MHLLRRGSIFLAAYLVLLIPTYVLPYFGSNSYVATGIFVFGGAGLLPQTWIHIGLLLAIVLITWLRGAYAAKAWIAVLPVLAGLTDLAPGFNLVPLLPSLFHALAMIFGARATSHVPSEGEPREQIAARSGRETRRLIVAASVFGLFTVAAAIASIRFYNTVTDVAMRMSSPAHQQQPQQSAARPAPRPQDPPPRQAQAAVGGAPAHVALPAVQATRSQARAAAPGAQPAGQPDLMTRKLTPEELEGKSAHELELMRNEIFARHGRIFNRPDLQRHFEGRPWYQGKFAAAAFPNEALTAVQKENVTMIGDAERRLKR